MDYFWLRELVSFFVHGLEGHAILLKLHSVFDIGLVQRADSFCCWHTLSGKGTLIHNS